MTLCSVAASESHLVAFHSDAAIGLDRDKRASTSATATLGCLVHLHCFTFLKSAEIDCLAWIRQMASPYKIVHPDFRKQRAGGAGSGAVFHLRYPSTN